MRQNSWHFLLHLKYGSQISIAHSIFIYVSLCILLILSYRNLYDNNKNLLVKQQTRQSLNFFSAVNR